MPEQELKPLNRRNFLGTISKATALGSLGFPPLAGLAGGKKVKATLPEGQHIFLTKPYLQMQSPHSMSIRWITNQPSYSWVEYGANGLADKKAHSVTDGLVNAYNRIHEVVIEGLQPGTIYQYRVVSKEIKEFQPYKLTYGEIINSDIHSFSTSHPNAKEVSWLVLNDIHDRPASFGQLMKMNGNDPYDFVFLNGDMFDYQSGEQQIIDHLITPCTEGFASQKPLLYVRGNHETRGRYARQLKDYFSNPGGEYFALQSGPVFLIALDTGEDKEDGHPVYAGIVDFDSYRERQAAWLKKQIQTRAFKKAKYRVVMMHIPPFYSGEGHGTLHCRKLFSPLFDQYKIDLVIAGHTHTYGVHKPVTGNHNYPIIIGGGPTEGSRTLIKVKAGQHNLTLQMIADNGREVGSLVLNANKTG
jgi:predicted phosphodiesterase